MTYGNFYFGKNGFLYKKNQSVGCRRNFAIGVICNQPQNVFNKYVPGSGVGAKSTQNRRAALIRATPSYPSAPFGDCFTSYGLFSKYASSSNNYPLNWFIK